MFEVVSLLKLQVLIRGGVIHHHHVNGMSIVLIPRYGCLLCSKPSSGFKSLLQDNNLQPSPSQIGARCQSVRSPSYDYYIIFFFHFFLSFLLSYMKVGDGRQSPVTSDLWHYQISDIFILRLLFRKGMGL